MSTNTGTAPRSTKALAVETKVNDGMITSSPGSRSASIARHLERAGARVGQQDMSSGQHGLELLVTPARERAVARQLMRLDRLADLLGLTRADMGPGVGNHRRLSRVVG